MYQYFLKIVPTQFSFLNGNSARTYQYSTTFNERDLSKQSAGGLPGKPKPPFSRTIRRSLTCHRRRLFQHEFFTHVDCVHRDASLLG